MCNEYISRVSVLICRGRYEYLVYNYLTDLKL